jgi:hypothetical protein
MAPSGVHPAGRRRVCALAIAASLFAAACSGATSTATTAPGASTPAATAGATLTTPATPVPTKGPATQHLSLTGPTGATGALSNASITCSMPSTDGPQISVLARPADPNLSVFVFVQPGKVSVRFDSGAGSTYAERDFEGTGVTNFDAAKGAQIDAQLTEVPTTDAHGTLGVLTSLSGTIDCGNQTPGSSTLVVSGPTAKGALAGGLDPVNVQCVTDKYGSRVDIMGIANVGTTPTLIIVSISPGVASVSASGDGFFRNGSATVASLTASGAHVDTDLVEENPTKGTTAHTIHLSGDATCGTTLVS